MSYVDLMSNDRWSEADHVARTEAMVRQHWSVQDETILNAKLWGSALSIQTLTVQDQADVQDLKAVREAAQQAGADARSDAAQLNSALDYEAVRAQLNALPPAQRDGSPDPYASEKSSLQAQLDAFPQATKDLVSQRDAWRAANGIA